MPIKSALRRYVGARSVYIGGSQFLAPLPFSVIEPSSWYYLFMSKKIIAEMDPSVRYRLAQEKTQALVKALMAHIPIQANNAHIVYSPDLAGQIPSSFAANAFQVFQATNLHYELVRLCSFWDRLDLDSRSLPTIIELADSREVSRLVYDDHKALHNDPIPGYADKLAKRARARLRTAIRDANKVSASSKLAAVQNYRNKLAHQLEITRAEKKADIPAPRYGDEKWLLDRTITAVDRFHQCLNGSGFDFAGSKDISKRNAEALWKGVTIKVLR